MSPRYRPKYKKNNQLIYRFQHEALNGAANLSMYVYDDPKELEDPTEFYDDWAKLVRDVEVDEKIPATKPIVFTGKVGDLEFKNKTTTYGRLKISKIVGADIDELGIFKTPYDRLNGGSLAKLSLYLLQFPDGIEKIKELQKLFYRYVSKAGVVTFSYKTLYADTNTETYKKICEIADDPEMSEKQKVLLMTELYDKYNREVEDKFSDDLKQELKMAERVKLSSIVSMSMPVLTISGVDEIPTITRGTLLDGLTEKDYINHAIENRLIKWPSIVEIL